MLSKEEIEDMKDNLKNLHHMLGKEPSISKDTIENALQYIEQLETKLETVTTQRNKLATELSDKEDDKQKLIEKLEEDIETAKKENAPYVEYKKESRMYLMNIGKILAEEKILKIAKGEKE